LIEHALFQKRDGALVRLDEAREGAQVLGLGPKCVVAEAALIAMRVDEGGVIEMGHGELLCLSSTSPAQTGPAAEITRFNGNDNGIFMVPPDKPLRIVQ